MTRATKAWHAAALIGCLVLLAALAWTNRNIADDAFAGFRYSENFANGHGLFWNPGEQVDGFSSSFLWFFLHGLVLKAGFEPVSSAFFLNISFYLVSLLLFYFIARRVLGSAWHALAAVAILGTNFTFNTAGTLGIGTHMQTVCLLACLATLMAFARGPERHAGLTLGGFSLLAGVSILVRMDSVLPTGILFVAALVHVLRPPATRMLPRLAALFLPAGILVGGWLIWKWSYFGTLIPITYYLKIPGRSVTAAGLYYIYAFLLSYLLIIQIPILLMAVWRMSLRTDWVIAASVAIVVSWFAYMVRIGGDFIEFRFLASILPFLILPIYWSIMREVPWPTLRAVLLGLLVLGSLQHQLFFGQWIFANCMYRPTLVPVTIAPADQHTTIIRSEMEIGQYLGRAFNFDPKIRIAICPGGVIPFITKFWTLDMLGMSDVWIARNGIPLFFKYIDGFYPGHVRMAPNSYIVERRVNFLLGLAILVRDDYANGIRTMQDLWTVMMLEDPAITGHLEGHKWEFPADALMVKIPVRPGYKLLTIYVTRDPHVDEVIAAHGWESSPLQDLPDS